MKKKKNILVMLLASFLMIISSCNNGMVMNSDELEVSTESRAVKLPDPKTGSQLIYEFLKGENSYVKSVNKNGISGKYIAMMGQGDNKYTPKHVSTSEAMGYGMRLAIYNYKSITPRSYAAWRAQQEYKTIFNDLWKVQHAFPSETVRKGRETFLHSWVIPKSMDAAERSSAAADGDMDIAYALLQAHELWGSNGSINYEDKAAKIINDIVRYMTATVTINGVELTYITVGDWVEEGSMWAEYSRPSDWMLHHFRTFQRYLGAKGAGRGNAYKTYGKLIKSVEYILDLNLYGTGLLPDFIHFDEDNNRIVPADPNSAFVKAMAEKTRSDAFSWNACRVPWRLAMDVIQEGRHHLAKPARRTLVNIHKTTCDGPGSSLRTGSGYELNGTIINPDFEIAFAAPLVASVKGYAVNNPGMAKGIGNYITEELRIITSQFMGKDPNLGEDEEDYTYYGDAILCFSTIILENKREIYKGPYQ